MLEAEQAILTSMCDDALALAARQGDARAFEELIDRYTAPLTAYLRRRCSSYDDAAELAQEAVLRAWRSLDRYDAKRSFRVWLFTIASRVAIDSLRSKRARGQREAARATDGTLREPPEAAPVVREEAGRLWRLADALLSPEQRLMLWLQVVEGRAPGEIARMLGKSGVGVRVALHRAREKLRKAVAAQPSQPVADEARGKASAGGEDADAVLSAPPLRATMLQVEG